MDAITLTGPSLRHALRLRLSPDGFSMAVLSGGLLRPRQNWIDTGKRSRGCIACGSTMSVAPTVLTEIVWLWGTGHRCRTGIGLNELGSDFDPDSPEGLLAYDAYLRAGLVDTLAAHEARQPELGGIVAAIDALDVPGTVEADILATHQRAQGGTRPFCSGCGGGVDRPFDEYWPCPVVATMARLHGIDVTGLDGYDWPDHCPKLHRTIAASVAATVAAGAPSVPGVPDISEFPPRRNRDTYRGYNADRPGAVQVRTEEDQPS